MSDLHCLHLIEDPKFTPLVVRRYFDGMGSATHTFIVPEYAKLPHDNNIYRFKKSILELREVVREESVDAVFFHGLGQDKLHLVGEFSAETVFVWCAWGADFYNSVWSLTRLYGPRTLLALLRHNPRLTRLLLPGHKTMKTYFGKKGVYEQAFQRIDLAAVICPNEGDHLKTIPGFTGRVCQSNYLGLTGLTSMPKDLVSTRRSDRVLLGQSASWSNNHLDAIHFVARHAPDCELSVPLSYGDDECRDTVLSVGRRLMKEHFHPVTEFMPYDRYMEWLCSHSAAIFNSKRQAGLGTLMPCLWLGMQVFFHRDSLVYDWLRKAGVTVYPLEQLANRDTLEPIDRSKQQQALRRELSTSAVSARTKAIFDAIRQISASKKTRIASPQSIG